MTRMTQILFFENQNKVAYYIISINPCHPCYPCSFKTAPTFLIRLVYSA